MEKQQVNPWSWQDKLGFSQAWRVDGAQAVIFVAGQGGLTADGELVDATDFDAQVRQTFENMQAVLQQAGGSLESIVKLTVFLTDMSRLRDFGSVRNEFFDVGRSPASTAVGVTALALPAMMVEVEAIAVV